MADATILFFLLICVGRGVFKGPVIELFSIAGTLCGLVVSGWLYLPMAAMIPSEIMSEPLRWTAGFLSLFGVVYFLLSLLGVIANYLMRLRRKGWLIHLSGAGLGLCKGILVVAVVLVSLIAFYPQKMEWLRRCGLYPFEHRISASIVRITPQGLQHRFWSPIDNDPHALPGRNNDTKNLQLSDQEKPAEIENEDVLGRAGR